MIKIKGTTQGQFKLKTSQLVFSENENEKP